MMSGDTTCRVRLYRDTSRPVAIGSATITGKPSLRVGRSTDWRAWPAPPQRKAGRKPRKVHQVVTNETNASSVASSPTNP